MYCIALSTLTISFSVSVKDVTTPDNRFVTDSAYDMARPTRPREAHHQQLTVRIVTCANSPGLTVLKWCSRTAIKATPVTMATPSICNLIPSHTATTEPATKQWRVDYTATTEPATKQWRVDYTATTEPATKQWRVDYTATTEPATKQWRVDYTATTEPATKQWRVDYLQ